MSWKRVCLWVVIIIRTLVAVYMKEGRPQCQKNPRGRNIFSLIYVQIYLCWPFVGETLGSFSFFVFFVRGWRNSIPFLSEPSRLFLAFSASMFMDPLRLSSLTAVPFKRCRSVARLVEISVSSYNLFFACKFDSTQETFGVRMVCLLGGSGITNFLPPVRKPLNYINVKKTINLPLVLQRMAVGLAWEKTTHSLVKW